MKIYHDRVLIAEVSDAGTREKGELWPRLVGVNISRSEGLVHVEPVYQPLVRYFFSPRYWVIDIWGRKKLRSFYLFPHWPFIELYQTDLDQQDEGGT